MANNDDLKFIVRSIGVGAIVASAMWWLFKKSNKKNNGPVLLESRDSKYSIELIKRTEISHDTRIFRFKLPSENHVLGLAPGKHVNLSAKIDGKLVVRSYTPVSSDETDKGYVDFIIKVYFPNKHPKFPDGGKLTMHLEKMKIGESIDVRGPNGKLEYEEGGILKIAKNNNDTNPEKRYLRQLGLIAGGSGITPMLQIIRHAMRHNDNIEIFLLYANQTEEDILCREELEKCKEESNGRFHLWYTLDRPPKDWKYSSGFINEEMIYDHMPKRQMAGDTTICICGPPPMIKFACLPNLEKNGWEEDMIFVY